MMLGMLLFTGAAQAQTQPYQWSTGLRLGYPFSVTLKRFLGHGSHALEGTVGRRNFGYASIHWTTVTGAYLVHRDMDKLLEAFNMEPVKNLSYYIGAGVAAYFWSYRNSSYQGRYGTTSMGIQAYIGSEYKIDNLPLSVGVDWVPTFFIGEAYYGGFGWGYGTLSVRYVFK